MSNQSLERISLIQLLQNNFRSTRMIEQATKSDLIRFFRFYPYICSGNSAQFHKLGEQTVEDSKVIMSFSV